MTKNHELYACAACLDGPKGIDGHDDLFARSSATPVVVFECSKCGSVWSREYAGSGEFTWARLATAEGRPD